MLLFRLAIYFVVTSKFAEEFQKYKERENQRPTTESYVGLFTLQKIRMTF